MFALIGLAIGIIALAAVFDVTGAGTVACGNNKTGYVPDNNFRPEGSKMAKASLYCDKGKPKTCLFEPADKGIDGFMGHTIDVGNDALCGNEDDFRCFCSGKRDEGKQVTISVKKEPVQTSKTALLTIKLSEIHDLLVKKPTSE